MTEGAAVKARKTIPYIVIWTFDGADYVESILNAVNNDEVRATNAQRAIEKVWKLISTEYDVQRIHWTVIAVHPKES